MSDRIRVGFVLALALAFLAPAVWAEDPEEEKAALVERLEERWEVLPLRDGYALRPLEPRDDLKLVEVAPDGLAIDGVEVDEEELRDRVGSDGREILTLAERVADGEPLEVELRDAEVERELTRVIEERAERERRAIERRLDRHRDELRRQLHEAQRRAEREVEHSRRSRRERGDQRVSFGSGLTLEEGETARDVVVLLGSAVLRGDVRGSATAVGGSVEVDGEVTEDVVAVGGSVSLGPRARVGGDVVAIGGSVDRQPGAEIDGQVTEISVAALAMPRAWLDRWSSGWWGWTSLDWPHLSGFLGGSGSLPERVGSAVLLALLLLGVVWVAPRRTAAVAERVELEPVKSLLTGVATEVLYCSVLVFLVFLLAITIIGLPLAALLLILGCMALVVAFYLGYAGSALVVGRRLGERFGTERLAGLAPGIVALLVGVAVIQGWSVIGKGLAILPWPLRWIGVLVLLFGFGVRYLAWTTGLGALVLNQLAPLPAVPPLPVESPPPADEPELDPEGDREADAYRGADDDTGA